MANNLYRIFPGKVRRDGKIPVTFVYPISDKRITKLMTPERLSEALAARAATVERERQQDQRGGKS